MSNTLVIQEQNMGIAVPTTVPLRPQYFIDEPKLYLGDSETTSERQS